MYTTLIYRCPTSSSCIIALTWDLWDYSEKNDHIKFYCRKYQYFWGLFRYIFEIEEARLFIPALKNFTFDHLTTITISKLSTNVTMFWAKKTNWKRQKTLALSSFLPWNHLWPYYRLLPCLFTEIVIFHPIF